MDTITAIPSFLRHQAEAFSPLKYGKTRNYTDGAVSELGRYFTHGVMSPVDFLLFQIERHGLESCQKLISQMAWREYFQGVWKALGDGVLADVKSPQHPVVKSGVPSAVANAQTGIDVIDDAVIRLYTDGLMHNHERLWLASCVCNIANFHWFEASRWLHYHLLDGDIASNSLSWQWVAGTFSHKKYWCNQENINRFSRTSQKHSLLSKEYAELPQISPPQSWRTNASLSLTDQMPKRWEREAESVILSARQPVVVHSLWNLDPDWLNHLNPQRMLLIEPSNCVRFPMSERRWAFIEEMVERMGNIQIVYAEWDELEPVCDGYDVHFIDHPMTEHWVGNAYQPRLIFPQVKGYYPSFSKFWKKAQYYIPDLLPSACIQES